MRQLVAAQRAGEIVLNPFLRIALILIAELHPDTGRALALSPLRCNPDDLTRNGYFLVLSHATQENENLVAEFVAGIRRDKQATVRYERHIGEIQRAFVLDRECQKPGFSHVRPRCG